MSTKANLMYNDIPVSAMNVETGEEQIFPSMAKASRMLYIKSSTAISENIYKGRYLKGVKSYKTNQKFQFKEIKK